MEFFYWRAVGTIVMFDKADWISFSTEGFFDGTSRGWKNVPFRFPTNPLKFYEPEQFFNLFYQPGMITDILDEGEKISEILSKRRDPRAKLNVSKYLESSLPVIHILTPKQDTTLADRNVMAEIEAYDTGSGLKDLRLFRNQTLVHIEHGDLPVEPTRKSYRISVPVNLVAGRNEISCYVFNQDNLKSKDARITANGTESLARKGIVYIIAIGIDRHANPAFNLNYAIADAKAVADTIKSRMMLLEQYNDVNSIIVQNEDATKETILAIFSLLSGEYIIVPEGFPHYLTTLKSTTPEDAVIVFFAGHGTSTGNDYLLIMQDYGMKITQPLNQLNPIELSTQTISMEDLHNGFEKIDAGNILLIIDACESGQALEMEEWRRGPLNVRGFPQLAYEKGMYVLAAAQSYQTALEINKLGHGLLTYVLIEKGLSKMAADSQPPDGQVSVAEWLDYAVEQFPKEYREIAKSRNVKVIGIQEWARVQQPLAYYRNDILKQSFIVSKQKSIQKRENKPIK